jgi:hypothetical protein
MINCHVAFFKFTQHTCDITLVKMTSFGIVIRSRQRLGSLVLLRVMEAAVATELSSRCTGSKVLIRTSSVTTQEKGRSVGNIIFSFLLYVLLSFYCSSRHQTACFKVTENCTTLQHKQENEDSSKIDA